MRLERSSIETIVEALNQAEVRYLVAGGLAVVAHGHVRFTADIDLIVDLETDNLRRALKALGGLGYRARAPVPLEDFLEPMKRRFWLEDKGLRVFSLFSARHEATEVDLFVETPLPFEAAYERAERMEIAPGVVAPFVGFEDLLEMKRQAGRPHDLDDIERLKALREALDER